MSAALGVPTMLYMPFCIFNIAAPIISMILGFTGFQIKRMKPSDVQVETAPTPGKIAESNI
jgi:NhaC family Na+:H+ antiporter